MTTAYQHGRYVLAHTSDTGENAMTCRRPRCCPPWGSSVCQPAPSEPVCPKKSRSGLFRHDYGAGNNDTPVARHNRPGGRPWVVISKTPGEPASGCKRSTRLPCSHVCGGRAANTAQKTNQTMKTTLSLTSDPCGAERDSAPHPFAVNGG